jgi:2-methylcitrate dehydratase PrpD
MHAGRSSQSGLYGALLAANGFTGIQDVFESPYGGFCSTFSRSADRFNLAELTGGLGTRFETLRISLKMYSCVGSNHTTLDSLRDMRARHPFGAGDVDHIVVHGSQVTVDHCGWKYIPNGVTGAQLNLPYCVATLLLENEVFVDQFSPAVLDDPARIALADKVTVLHDPTITARGSGFRHAVRVEVHLKDGTRLTEQRDAPRAFASDDAIIGKFRNLAGHRFGAAQVDRLVNLVLGLEDVADVGALTDALRAA